MKEEVVENKREFFKNKKGEIVGWLSNHIYYKQVNSKKHRMKIYNGYGIDETIVYLIQDKCEKIRLKELDTDNIYEVSFDIFMDKNIKGNFDGVQFFLPLKYWTIENQGRLLTVSD